MAFEKAFAYLSHRGFAQRVRTFSVSSATLELAAQALGTEPARIAKSLTFANGEGGHYGGVRRGCEGEQWKIQADLRHKGQNADL